MGKNWTIGQTQEKLVVSLLSRLWDHLSEEYVGSAEAVCEAGPERLLTSVLELDADSKRTPGF